LLPKCNDQYAEKQTRPHARLHNSKPAYSEPKRIYGHRM
jgi:hypothetical protein